MSYDIDFGGTDLHVNTLSVGASTPGAAGTNIATSITEATITSTTGNITTVNSTTLNSTTDNTVTLNAGASGTAGTVNSFPATASKGKLALVGVANTGNTTTTISNAAMGQASVVSIPDPGAATANFLLDTGTGATATITTATLGTAAVNTQLNIAGAATIKSNAAALTATSNAATMTTWAAQITTPSLSTAGGSSQAEVITLTGVSASDLVIVTRAGGTNTTQNYSVNAVCTSNTITITIYNNTAATALNGTIILNVLWIKA
jgi:hypothetical protein